MEHTKDDWVGWEDGELWVKLVKEVKLIDSAADGGSEEENITLQPGDLNWRVLEADTWSCLGRHDFRYVYEEKFVYMVKIGQFGRKCDSN